MKNTKLNNKGFSLVELIIVIAIMAILAAALAPQLIKYIEKSRISSDKTAAASVKSAFDSAIANEAAYDAALASTSKKIEIATAADLSSTDALESEMKETLQDLKAPKSKVGKNGGKYVLTWSTDNNKISNIQYGTNTLGDANSDVMSN